MKLPSHLETLDAATITLIEQALPDSLEPIVEALGLSLTLALVEGLAGQEIEFPKTQHGPGAAKFAMIASVIGVDAAVVMGKKFGGERTYIPKCDHLRRVWRNFEVIRDYDALLKVTRAGNAARELCNRYGLSCRQVENIVNGKTEPKKGKGLHYPKTAKPALSACAATP